MMRVLLVEDDGALSQTLGDYLASEGFGVTIAASARAARQQMGARPDAVVLDWGLPDGSGIELLREWRAAGIDTPVLCLTARAELIDRVLGLELGADDYVTKPFEARELVARLRAQLRRTRPATAAPAAIERAGVRLSPAQHEVSFRGRAVSLKRMEFALLRFLMENAAQVFTRDELLNQVWGYDCYPTTRTVDTHILALRQKLHPALFETVRGIGYRFTGNLPPEAGEFTSG